MIKLSVDKNAVEAEINRLVSTSMKMDRRQQILLLITLAHRYSYYLRQSVKKGEVEHGDIFFHECFIEPCELVIGYLINNRKTARKFAKELKGAERILGEFVDNHQSDMNVMPVHAVLCLFLAVVLINGQSLDKGDWQSLYLYPSVGYGYGLASSDDDDKKNVIEAYIRNELDILESAVDIVTRKCPVQTRTSAPLADEFVAKLLDDSSYDLQRVFSYIDKLDKGEEILEDDEELEDLEDLRALEDDESEDSDGVQEK